MAAVTAENVREAARVPGLLLPREGAGMPIYAIPGQPPSVYLAPACRATPRAAASISSGSPR